MVKACCEILELGTMAQVCQEHIDILNVCCHKFHNSTLQPITFDPQDYADTMQHLVFELSQKLVPLTKKFSVGAAETALQPLRLPTPDEFQLDTSRNETATEASILSGLEEARPSTSSASQHPCDSDQEPGPSCPKKSSRKKVSPKKSSGKRVHYKQSRCLLCRETLVNMRRHLISMHSNRNEMIPVAKVEALLQASRHGLETSGGTVYRTDQSRSIRGKKRFVLSVMQ